MALKKDEFLEENTENQKPVKDFKEVFRAKLMERKEELSAGSKMTVPKLADLLEEKESTVKKWLSGKSLPKDLEKLQSIADKLDCDIPHLLGADERHFGNSFICEQTGLSQKSVEVLRYFNRKLQFVEGVENPVETLQNKTSLDVLNLILEECYSSISKHSPDSLFSSIWSYINADRIFEETNPEERSFNDGFEIRANSPDLIATQHLCDLARKLDVLRKKANNRK